MKSYKDEEYWKVKKQFMEEWSTDTKFAIKIGLPMLVSMITTLIMYNLLR